jgi:MFS family permease
MAGAALFADMATEMLTPVLPIFLTQTLNASGSIVGLVDGAAQAIRNIIDGFSGPISDTLRRRRIIAVLGFAMAALAKPLMGLSAIWQEVLAARIFDRLGAGVRSAPSDAIVASSVDKRHRGSGFGLEALGEYAGAFLGPIATVLLLYELHVDIRTIFYVAFIPGLLAVAIVWFVTEREPGRGPKKQVTIRPRGLPAGYWKFLVVLGVFSIGNSSNSFLILRTQEIGSSLPMTTLVYAGFNLVAALISYPAGSLSDRWGRKRVLLGSCTVFLIVYAGFALVENLAVLVGLFLLYGLYQGSFRSMTRGIASDLAPEQMRASAIGWFSATIGLCQLIAGIVAGLLWDHFGHSSAFIYGVASAFAGILGIALLIREGAR